MKCSVFQIYGEGLYLADDRKFKGLVNAAFHWTPARYGTIVHYWFAGGVVFLRKYGKRNQTTGREGSWFTGFRIFPKVGCRVEKIERGRKWLIFGLSRDFPHGEILIKK
jgi:hypothetical protein